MEVSLPSAGQEPVQRLEEDEWLPGLPHPLVAFPPTVARALASAVAITLAEAVATAVELA